MELSPVSRRHRRFRPSSPERGGRRASRHSRLVVNLVVIAACLLLLSGCTVLLGSVQSGITLLVAGLAFLVVSACGSGSDSASSDGGGGGGSTSTFTVSDASAPEGAGLLTFTVDRGGDTAGTASVDYGTADGTAVGGTDFTAASGTLDFADGETQKTIDVTVTDDTDFERDETFTVTLSNAQGGTIDQGTGQGSIGNDESTLDVANLTADLGFTVSGAAGGDHLGSGGAIAGAGDVNDDGIHDVILGAEQANSLAGEAYIVFGASGGGPGDIDLASLASTEGVTFSGSGRTGRSVSGGSDVSGDGIADVAVGAPYHSYGTTFVVFGDTGGPGGLDLTSLAAADGFTVSGDYYSDDLGLSVSMAGDIDNDGYNDVAIAAWGHYSDYYAGEGFVIFGADGGPGDLVAESMTSAQGFDIYGAAYSAGMQEISGVGDVNGDNIADVAMAAPDVEEAYVIFGAGSGGPGDIDISSLAAAEGFTIYNGGGLGSVAGAGDVDGDGAFDVIVGSSGADPSGRTDAGAAYVIFGNSDGTSPGDIDLSNLASTDGFTIIGAASYDRIGVTVSGVGDVNSDGYDDLLVGNNSDGPAAVVFGAAGGPGDIDLGSFGYPAGFTITGAGPVAAVGDLNGDGVPDIGVGNRRANPNGRTDAGAVYVIFGPF